MWKIINQKDTVKILKGQAVQMFFRLKQNSFYKVYQKINSNSFESHTFLKLHEFAKSHENCN